MSENNTSKKFFVNNHNLKSTESNKEYVKHNFKSMNYKKLLFSFDNFIY
jgi:hypothetical protein